MLVWRMAGQTDRVMTTDKLSIFQTDRILEWKGRGDGLDTVPAS